MAFLGLQVPPEVARLLGQVEVPGELIPLHEKHITLLHLGSNIPIETVAMAVVATHEVVKDILPFPVLVQTVTTFPEGPDGVPIIGAIESPELHALRDGLAASFEAHKVPYSKRHPVFKPHVTLSYSEEGVKDFSVGPLQWSIYEVVLWGGDSNDERVSVHFPFTLAGPEMLNRQLVQARTRFARGS